MSEHKKTMPVTGGSSCTGAMIKVSDTNGWDYGNLLPCGGFELRGKLWSSLKSWSTKHPEFTWEHKGNFTMLLHEQKLYVAELSPADYKASALKHSVVGAVVPLKKRGRPEL